MAAVVVDASVVLKWLLPEPQSAVAIALLKNLADRELELTAPALLEVEVASGLQRQAMMRNLLPEELEQAWNAFQALGFRHQSPGRLWTRTFEVATALNASTVHEAVYTALSDLLQCEYWTASRRFYVAAQVRFPQVRWLGDFAITESPGYGLPPRR